ncbi:MAG TPA: hypothetical protein VIW73_12145 [Candidatus Cybelea sp.]
MRTIGSAVCIAAALVALAGCSRGTRATNPTPSPQGPAAQPAPVPQPTATPSVSPTAAATAPVITPTPAPVGQATTAAAPRLAKPVPRVATDAPPQILAISISETTVRPGDRVSGSVITSSNVASVEARIGGYAMPLAKLGVGRFALTYTVAPLPWFVRGNFTLQVIARNTRGDAATRAIPLTVR